MASRRKGDVEAGEIFTAPRLITGLRNELRLNCTNRAGFGLSSLGT
jgi:hypothetical protein